jgi:hypothetical protein
MLKFQIWGPRIHLSAFRMASIGITPTLKVGGARASLVVLFGYRTIEPKNMSVVPKRDNHIQSVEFEVVQRSRFSGRMLSAVTLGATLGFVLQRAKPNTSSSGR